jgi:hypothetical protein
VCIGAHDLILNFDGGVSVTVTSCIGFTSSSTPTQRYDDFRQAASILVTLINQKIVSAEGEKPGTLTLKFDDDRMLSVYDDSREYESYAIKNGEQLIVV